MIQLTLTLKMTTAQVVETSVTVNNNSPIQDYVNPDDQTQPTFDIYIFNLTSQNYKEGSYYSIRAHYRKYCTIMDSEKWNPCQDIEFLQQQLENPRQKERNSMNIVTKPSEYWTPTSLLCVTKLNTRWNFIFLKRDFAFLLLKTENYPFLRRFQNLKIYLLDNSAFLLGNPKIKNHQQNPINNVCHQNRVFIDKITGNFKTSKYKIAKYKHKLRKSFLIIYNNFPYILNN